MNKDVYILIRDMQPGTVFQSHFIGATAAEMTQLRSIGLIRRIGTDRKRAIWIRTAKKAYYPLRWGVFYD